MTISQDQSDSISSTMLGSASKSWLGESMRQSYFGGSLLRRFAIDYAIGTVINTICAVLVCKLILPGSSFYDSWIFSMCIGSLVMWLVDGARLLIWRGGKPHMLGLMALILVNVPISYFGGSYLASKILAIPTDTMFAHQVEHAAPLMTMIFTVCVVFAWFNWNQSELAAVKAAAASERARVAAIEKQAMQAQLQLLQAQIEPHMLFNTLANLQGLIGIDPPRAQYMLDQLIHYLRASLSSSRAEKTTLAHEFELMQAYLELMSVRMGSRLSYHLDLPEDLSKFAVPPMLLQPLVENAIKHGLENKIEGGRIEVKASREGEAIVIVVVDNGQGLEASAAGDYLKHGTGLGVSNVRDRLRALHGEHATLTLEPNTPQGAIAKLTLPHLS